MNILVKSIWEPGYRIYGSLADGITFGGLCNLDSWHGLPNTGWGFATL